MFIPAWIVGLIALATFQINVGSLIIKSAKVQCLGYLSCLGEPYLKANKDSTKPSGARPLDQEFVAPPAQYSAAWNLGLTHLARA